MLGEIEDWQHEQNIRVLSSLVVNEVDDKVTDKQSEQKQSKYS
jgi:hypothetical protein